MGPTRTPGRAVRASLLGAAAAGEGCADRSRARGGFGEPSANPRAGVGKVSLLLVQVPLQGPHRSAVWCCGQAGSRDWLGLSIFWCSDQVTMWRYRLPSQPV